MFRSALHPRFCSQNAQRAAPCDYRGARVIPVTWSGCRGTFCLPIWWPKRSVNAMDAIFNSIRRIKFRRGPQRLLGGLAGGVAARFDINVWLVRLLVLISFLLPVVGVLFYLMLWLVTPWQDDSIPLERVLTNPPGAR